ncbi:hypothetical protein [Methylobacterium sp. 22177]|uniref:hypothetical protein n=1 Tax=Methylobacterium sp. 22177 TaxID=3453885 RepID=UPI003F859A3B
MSARLAPSEIVLADRRRASFRENSSPPRRTVDGRVSTVREASREEIISVCRRMARDTETWTIA